MADMVSSLYINLIIDRYELVSRKRRSDFDNCDQVMVIDETPIDEQIQNVLIKLHGPDSKWRSKERSEEHTSELQSHSDLVCRLLLEKKKKRIIISNKIKKQNIKKLKIIEPKIIEIEKVHKRSSNISDYT